MQERHEHRLEQRRSGFAEGVDQKPDTPAEKQEPDFARGAREGPATDVESRPRFSEGGEDLPDTPDKTVERRFSEGIERSPSSD